MTFLTLPILAIALASPGFDDCSLPPGSLTAGHVFTNADLERMSPCRYQTGAQSQPGTPPVETPVRPGRQGSRATAPGKPRLDGLEADWRRQWRSVDQKTRKLRREAHELRQEAGEVSRNPKRGNGGGRRSPSFLITRAEALEAEARELLEQFNARARREGALPGWIRPQSP
jgi:hypothetical protein